MRGGLLTPRQREIMELVAGGVTTSRIAVRLGISPATVRTHVDNVLDRTGAHNRAHAVALLRLSAVPVPQHPTDSASVALGRSWGRGRRHAPAPAVDPDEGMRAD